MSGGDGNTAGAQPGDPGATAVGRAGLLGKLMAAVRPEFRGEELVFDQGGPVFGGPPCRVPGCVRAGRARGLCWGHNGRWARAGKPDLEQFLATTDPRWRRQAPYASCRAAGCCYGRRCRGGLCPRHHQAWQRAGRPALDGWLTSLAAPDLTQTPPLCRIASCELWVQPGLALCWRHGQRWKKLGCPSIEEFAAGFDDDPVPGHERIDLRRLGPGLRLEMQYVLQRRHDEATTKTRPSTARTVVALLADSQVDSLLDRPEQDWQPQLRGRHSQATTAHAFLIYAVRQIEDLAVGSGWDVEYPRDVWRLRSIGIDDKPHAALRFAGITQPWLKDLAKRWARGELSTGTSVEWVHTGVAAVTRFGRFLASPAVHVDHLAALDRTVLERYLATLQADLGGKEIHRKHIVRLNAFLHAIRQHRWADTLPANAMFYAEDYPEPRTRLPRALAEHVMAQVEHPDNLNRWDNPAYHLITIILMRCGLRISDAVKLPYDCLVTDPDRAPYLRYLNHKMKREALVPIDEELHQMIMTHQRALLQRWPDATPVLFPRPTKNPDGSRPTASSTYRIALYRWLHHCDVRDEHGLPVRLTPHQWRHTVGTRLINRDVPQEVVRVLLDHDSPEMTAHYARLHDTTVRRHWEQARKVNASGQTVTFDPEGPLAEALWAKQRISRATQALPNGYCGLPVQRSCPHANACLTCPMFITTAEFLPQHHQHHQQILQIVSAAEAHGQMRLAEMNRQVAGNLEKIINALEDHGHQETATDAS